MLNPALPHAASDRMSKMLYRSAVRSNCDSRAVTLRGLEKRYFAGQSSFYGPAGHQYLFQDGCRDQVLHAVLLCGRARMAHNQTTERNLRVTRFTNLSTRRSRRSPIRYCPCHRRLTPREPFTVLQEQCGEEICTRSTEKPRPSASGK